MRTRMEYVAVASALAVFGGIVGLRFRLRVLLYVVLVLFLMSLAFSLIRGIGWLGTPLVILAAQAALQGGYVVGLVIRASFKAAQRRLSLSSERYRSS